MDVEFSRSSEVQAWLEDKPAFWAHALALRSALRALPFLLREPSHEPLRVAALRAALLAWIAGNVGRTMRVELAVKGAADALAQTADEAVELARAYTSVTALSKLPSESRGARASAFAAARAVSYATRSAIHLRHASYAAAASGYADDALAYGSGARHMAASRAGYQELSRDADFLVRASEAQDLLFQELWREDSPASVRLAWTEALETLSTPESAVWDDWYQRRRMGTDQTFTGDVNRDRAVVARVLEQPEAFWNRPLAAISADLARWINDDTDDTYVAPNTPEDFRREANRVLDPDVVLNDGRLAIRPNPVMAASDDDTALESTLAILRGLLPLVLAVLPGNAHGAIRECVKGYDAHLGTCGQRPIIGLLDDLAAVVSRGVEVTDPREWDAGAPLLVERFINRHKELKQHFPNLAQRDLLIASARVSDAPGSDHALVASATQGDEAIRELADEGFTTPSFDEAASEQFERAKEAAQPSAQLDVVKPRLITQLIGFYDKAASLLANTTKVFDSPAAKAALDKLADAVEKLLDLLHL